MDFPVIFHVWWPPEIVRCFSRKKPPFETRFDTVDGWRNPTPVENGGLDPMISRVSTCFNHPFGDAGFLPSTVPLNPMCFFVWSGVLPLEAAAASAAKSNDREQLLKAIYGSDLIWLDIYGICIMGISWMGHIYKYDVWCHEWGIFISWLYISILWVVFWCMMFSCS